MIQGRGTIELLDIVTMQDAETGMREPKVTRARVIPGRFQKVGQNTFWQSHAASVTLSFSVRIRAAFFNEEKYVARGNEIFEIINIGKTETVNEILLNVKKISDESLEKAVQEWRGRV